MAITINWVFIIISFCAILLDIASGIIKAFKNKNVSSQKLKLGLYHKSAFLLIIAFSILLQVATAYGMAEYAGINATVPFVEFTCGYIVATEAVSIIENCAEINPELQKSKLLDYFSKEAS